MQKYLPVLVFFLIHLHSAWAFDLHLPTDMNASDRDQSLSAIGLTASGKLISDPYPLGGYSGVEVGISAESLPTQNLNTLGSKSTQYPDQVSFEELSVGKGLYKNIDLFLNFTPWGRSSGITQYGGMMRWGFYEAKYFPLSCSLLIHAGILNIHDDFVSRSLGADVMAAVNVDHFGIYFGGGKVQAQGYFGPSLNSSGTSATAEIQSDHTFFGAYLQLGDIYFLAAQIDKYTLPVYSAKFGIRY